jgi:hypothetical protein
MMSFLGLVFVALGLWIAHLSGSTKSKS